jgi:glycosyltransferase involved in cell wall biosynthesis
LTSPVRAALDIQALQVAGFADRGIGRYVSAYSTALARAGRVAAALLAPELPPASGLPVELVAGGLVCWDCIGETRRLLSGPDRVVYHVTAPFLHAGPDDPPSLAVAPHWAHSGAPRVVTLYDLIPLRAPRHYLPTEGHRERYRARAAWVAAADLVLAISEHTRREAIALLGCAPDRVVTVGAGVSPFFCPPDGTDDELWQLRLGALEGRPYVLTVGGSDARKGTERLIAAVGLLAARGWDLHLVVVGDLTDAWRRRLHDTARAAGLADRVVLTGPVGDGFLRACYRRAAVTVMPSLAEGSGLPVLESAASGTPALASATTSLAEVSATPLAGFDPTDTDAVADAIARLLGDEGRRAEVLAAQQALAGASSWEAVATRTAAAYDRLGESGPAAWRVSPVPRPLQIAVAGPLPPEGGGVGAYMLRLLATRPVGVELYAVTAGLPIPDVPPGVRHVRAATFGSDVRPASFDAVVYALGNSAGHLPTIELALRHPGWLWLHQVRLPAIATTGLADADDEQFEHRLARLLQRAYPGRPPLAAARRAGRSNLDLIAAGVGLVAPLAERCRGILVNSEAARRLLLLDLAPLAAHPPVHVLPPGCPPVRPRPAGAAGAAGDGTGADPLVAAFGVVTMAKRPDLLVDAAALVGCRLAFVGPCPPVLAEAIAARGRARGIAERVEVVGSVDYRSWRDWMDRTTLAVQLRATESGETSTAVLEALAAGLPVLTNMTSAAEYPEGTVARLDGSEPADLADRMSALLASPATLRGLAAAGHEFAAGHQFDRLAATLVSIVTA